MKKIILIVIVFIVCSCASNNEEKLYQKHKQYRFEVRPTEDNSWTSSGRYLCDSIKFINQNEAIIYTDRRTQKIYSRLIRVYQLY